MKARRVPLAIAALLVGLVVAVAQGGDQGGGVSGAANVSEGMDIYQFTENGISLSATISGTKYWKDKQLNY